MTSASLAHASALALVVSGVLAAPVLAQTTQIDEIVVTAERRETSLRRTPLSVSVAAQPLLAGAGVVDIKDLAILTPGLLVASSSNQTNTTARIRGIGTVGENPGLESSVGVIVDGVFRARNGVALGDLGEVERTEVLRGPQSTLFGQNTSAGVINIVTAGPKFDFGATGEATVGDHGARGGSVSVTGPLIEDKLAGRLYAAVRRRDGFYDVRTGNGPRTETDDQNEAYETVRGQLLWTPTASISNRLSADFTHRDERCCIGVQQSTGPTAGILALLSPDGGVMNPAALSARTGYANRDTNTRIKDGGVSLHTKIDTRLGVVELTTAARQWRAVLSQDWDFTSADIAYRPDDGRWSNRFRTFSHEARLTGSRGAFDYTGGVYLMRETLLRRDAFLYGSAYEDYLGRILTRSAANPVGLAGYVSTLTRLPVGQNFVSGQGALDTYKQTATTAALFGQTTWHATDKLGLTLGLRYSHIEKDLDAAYTNTDSGRACAAALARGITNATICLPWANPAFNNLSRSEGQTDDGLSGLARVEYQLTPSVLTYVSYARGRKSAGYNLDRAQTNLIPDASTAFAPEVVDSVEVGAKATLLGGRLLLSGDAFHQAYTDFQLNTFLGTTFLVKSIPEVTAKGAELEGTLRPMPGLSLQAGVVYAQTEYGDAPVPGLPLLAGSRLSFAPLWSGSLSGTYRRDIGDGFAVRATLAGKYSSSYNTGSDLAPEKVQPGFWLANGSVGLEAEAGWSVELWGRNLFDEDYRQVAFGAPFQAGTIGAFLGAPRTVGVTLRVTR
ncbi:MAG TPA: TonB-dependent receptor [Brevundimonas sp.]|jgi:outer membrane receptor protein involved in Fe transport